MQSAVVGRVPLRVYATFAIIIFCCVLIITPTTSGDDSQLESDSIVLLNMDGDPCDADLDGNGYVGTGDLLMIFWAWFSGDVDSPADLNGDGIINTQDLLCFFEAYGSGCK